MSARPAPAFIAELATAGSEYVERSVGVPVDFHADTLSIVDHYVQLVRQQADDRPEIIPLIARALGAYLGELIREQLGFFWLAPTDDAHHWFVCGRHVEVAINPVGIVYDAIHQGQGHDGPSSHLRVSRDERDRVAARLEQIPPVPEDEYYLLTTRLEALEVVVEMLGAGQSDDDEEPTLPELSAEDYEDLIDMPPPEPPTGVLN